MPPFPDPRIVEAASARRLPPDDPTPVLRVDTAAVRRAYLSLSDALPGVGLHYAVKANPAPAVLRTLAEAGARWDVASAGEIDAVLAIGGDPGDMCFGNTVKRTADVAYAHALGIDRFTVDAADEVDKVTRFAPGSTVLVRIATSGQGAGWALGGKFGCTEEEAAELLARALRAGHRVGVSFHVGSQQVDPWAWDAPLAAVARLRARLRGVAVGAGRPPADLAVVDIGGGFPARLSGTEPGIAAYGAAIRSSLDRHLGPDAPTVIAEPGRFLVADAGELDSEVLLVAQRAGRRWVHLDVGLFTGLVETIGEQIRYPLRVLRNGRVLAGPVDEVVFAGPSCDSLDVLYPERRYRLPVDLRTGDRVRFLATGAYTAPYSTVGFNGFAPLRQVWS